MDPGGNVFVAWVEDGDVKTKRYEAGTSWADWASGGAVTVLDDNGGCTEPWIAVDINGRAIAVWARGLDVFSKRYFE